MQNPPSLRQKLNVTDKETRQASKTKIKQLYVVKKKHINGLYCLSKKITVIRNVTVGNDCHFQAFPKALYCSCSL